MRRYKITPTVGDPAVILAETEVHARSKGHALIGDIWAAHVLIVDVEDIGEDTGKATTS